MMAPEPGSNTWGSTLRVRAEVLVTGGRSLIGFLHLQPLALFHSGPESPEDVLNRDEAYFPLTSENQTIFLAKSQVIAVTVSTVLPVRDLDRVEAARTLGMQVELSDGSEVYSVRVHGLTGNVETVDGEVLEVDEFMHKDIEGNREAPR